jgi:hypothetical protein
MARSPPFRVDVPAGAAAGVPDAVAQTALELLVVGVLDRAAHLEALDAPLSAHLQGFHNVVDLGLDHERERVALKADSGPSRKNRLGNPPIAMW